eukprot:CAMPEP_0198434568 /NCGR_PEP_ID=MMETSP1452-20131203/33357_1 /TAXON_ID=1181717 /ORGANISM="Synchroma pusillum, Strain CCMP3072" /LENGTH=351 /DNA_ID=CAMNT_0044155081 /DNA_START=21 /DNA_END=1076 /DNA_ORIENTATION=+
MAAAVVKAGWIRPLVLRLVLSPRATAALARFQRVCGVREDGTPSNPLLHHFFHFATNLGDEAFYASIMPLCCWLGGYPLALEMICMFMLQLVAGQVVKEILQLPRPRDDRIAVLEHHYATEYGFPSTHTMSGYLAFHFVALLSERHAASHPLLFPAALLFALSISTSRLYLGVHSVADVAGGVVLGWGVLQAWQGLRHAAVEALLHPTAGPGAVAAVVAAFLFLFPRPAAQWSSAPGTTAVILGVWTGVTLGCSLVRGLAPSTFASVPGSLASTPAPVHVLRALVGYLGMLLAKVLVKALARRALGGPDGGPVDAQGHVPYGVDVPTKLWSYGAVGAAAVGMPLLWPLLGL